MLSDFEAATLPNRPFVELIGMKAQNFENAEFKRVHVAEFKEHLQNDTAITEQIRPYVKMGLRFRWTGYSDPTGIECCLAIGRNAEAERKLREWIQGPDASGDENDNQPSFL